MFYIINICGIKLYNYIVIPSSQFIRSISCISSYMFRLIYRAIFRLVFREICTYNCWCFLSTNNCTHKHVAGNTTNTSNKLRVVYDYIIL